MNVTHIFFYSHCGILAASASLISLYGSESAAPSALVESVSEETKREISKRVFDVKPELLPCFGSNLFRGNFSKRSVQDFNPDYQISIGDQIMLHIWGSMSFSSELVVDTQGNIFVPTVGPIHILNVKNEDLNRVIDEAIRRHYRDNVRVYALLAAAKPVSIYVSGFVQNPGNYDGVCSESILHFIDRAGGIDPKKGSFLDIRLLREGKVVATFDLYQFLLRGSIQALQLRTGDVIWVGSKKHSVYLFGDVQHANAFEFQGDTIRLSDVLDMAIPRPGATHILRTQRANGQVIQTRIEWPQRYDINVQDGDVLEIGSEKSPQQVLVKLTGEYEGDATLVLEKSCTLKDLFDKGLIRASAIGDIHSLQLFRKSVAQQQKEMVEKSLSQLERQMMFSAPINSEEAKIRIEEAKIFKNFIDEARKLEPRGLVVMNSQSGYGETFLEDGDVLHIPAKTYTIAVSGSVRIPMTFSYQTGRNVSDYIQLAGGLTKEADPRGILIIHPNGESQMLQDHVAIRSSRQNRRAVSFRDRGTLLPGDTIMVLPKVSTSSMLLAQSVADILYKIAIVTRTVVKW
ncbi:MAG: polysaccharide biosynthesis/export family protein [Puniceicoccales bacterium]|jgi:protein involved in polysaccharide export with SLBB domain|nr:polysaccharide biosynthesis/export family protein [Puniceicoccales bacterium]